MYFEWQKLRQLIHKYSQVVFGTPKKDFIFCGTNKSNKENPFIDIRQL